MASSLGTLGATRHVSNGWKEDVDRAKVQLWTQEMKARGRDVDASLEAQAKADLEPHHNVRARYNNFQLRSVTLDWITRTFAGAKFTPNTTVGEANA